MSRVRILFVIFLLAATVPWLASSRSSGEIALPGWLLYALLGTLVLVIVLELLVQASPVVLMGVSDAKRYAGAMLAGAVTGVAVALSLLVAGRSIPEFSGDPLGIDADVLGLVASVLVSCCAARLQRARRLWLDPDAHRVGQTFTRPWRKIR